MTPEQLKWAQEHRGVTRCRPGVAQGVFDPAALRNTFVLIDGEPEKSQPKRVRYGNVFFTDKKKGR
jgi:hypothetical protein